MACGKGNNNKPIEDFITHSPAPVDTAAKMSAIYTELSFKVTERRYRIFLHICCSRIFHQYYCVVPSIPSESKMYQLCFPYTKDHG